MPTYGATIWCSGNDIVLKLKVRVEDGGVQLDLSVKAVADSFPAFSGLRHSLCRSQQPLNSILQAALGVARLELPVGEGSLSRKPWLLMIDA